MDFIEDSNFTATLQMPTAFYIKLFRSNKNSIDLFAANLETFKTVKCKLGRRGVLNDFFKTYEYVSSEQDGVKYSYEGKGATGKIKRIRK